MCSLPLSVDLHQARKPDLRKVGRDIYEVLTNGGHHGYKQRMRRRTFKIDQEQDYGPSEVAVILNVSYDAASRLIQKLKGVVDLGTPTRRYNRGKKKLRISGKNLLAFLRSKTRDSLPSLNFKTASFSAIESSTPKSLRTRGITPGVQLRVKSQHAGDGDAVSIGRSRESHVSLTQGC